MTKDELKEIMPEELRRINNQGYINQHFFKSQEKWNQLQVLLYCDKRSLLYL